MKNVSSLKSTKSDSPKTPGGISKSLLTPCRRLGLSRNYKKAGPVPFISPLAGSSCNKVDAQLETKKPTKRKTSEVIDENEDEQELTPVTQTEAKDLEIDKSESPDHRLGHDEELSGTPIRHLGVPRKKRSKTLLTSLSIEGNSPLVEKQPENESINSFSHEKEENEIDTAVKENVIVPQRKSNSKHLRKCQDSHVIEETKDDFKDVTPLKKAKTKRSISRHHISPKTSPKCSSKKIKDLENVSDQTENQENLSSVKPRSPNELTKECIVVIQKKIFKSDTNTKKSSTIPENIDSESDDIPLCKLNKDKELKPLIIEKNMLDNDTHIYKEKEQDLHIDNKVHKNKHINDDDFVDTLEKNTKNLKDKSTSISGLKNKTKNSKACTKTSSIPVKAIKVADFDDDEDDFDLDNKKTILIRKTYEKVSKPQKAKTTGSITQRDIDELKARIESKKKLLLARAMTEDTEELRSLIKKWQKGCQDALMELMELMKNKFPDRQNMDYSEMLSMLKIPVNLVGYDEENDCFTTPEDSNIILSKFE